MARGIYIGVESAARKTKQVYIGVNGVARKAKKGYAGVGGVARPFYEQGTSFGKLDIGASVWLNVGGVKTEFLVVHQGLPDAALYDASCDGTWLLMKDLHEKRVWSDVPPNVYASSSIHSYLNGDFLALLDSGAQSVIKEVKIPYGVKTGVQGSTLYSGVDGLLTRAFLLSSKEVYLPTNDSYFGANDGACLAYFDGCTNNAKIAYFEGSALSWWLRSPYVADAARVYAISHLGAHVTGEYNGQYGVRPAVIMPYDAVVDHDCVFIG